MNTQTFPDQSDSIDRRGIYNIIFTENVTERPIEESRRGKSSRVKYHYTMADPHITSNLNFLPKYISALYQAYAFTVQTENLPEIQQLAGSATSTEITVGAELDVQPTSQLAELSIKCNIPVTVSQETKEICRRTGLFPYIEPICDMIHNMYRSVLDMELELEIDPADREYKKLCFEIHLSSEPDQILDDEDRFYDEFFKRIPENKQDSFIFTYRVS